MDVIDVKIKMSILMAQENSSTKYFEQSDVRFYLELFSEWVLWDNELKPLPIHNTQIMRTLEKYVSQRLIHKIKGRNRPQYRLSKKCHECIIKQIIDKFEYLEPQQLSFVLPYIMQNRLKSLKIKLCASIKNRIKKLESMHFQIKSRAVKIDEFKTKSKQNDILIKDLPNLMNCDVQTIKVFKLNKRIKKGHKLNNLVGFQLLNYTIGRIHIESQLRVKKSILALLNS